MALSRRQQRVWVVAPRLYIGTWSATRPLKEVLSDAREDALDLAESKLMEAIRNGNLTAIIFFLKTRGKSRGYSERGDLVRATGDRTGPGYI